MSSDLIYVECLWCGNRWYQEDGEINRCEVCQHYPWEGTHEMHMQFPDLEAWRIFTEKQKEKYKDQVDWDYKAHENPYG